MNGVVALFMYASSSLLALLLRRSHALAMIHTHTLCMISPCDLSLVSIK